jgi:hypothetical protein
MHMVRTICKSLMQSLVRIIPAIKRNTRKTATANTVHRRVEVTVQRESVSIWVRGPSGGRAEGVDGVDASLESGPPSRSGSKEEPTR